MNEKKIQNRRCLAAVSALILLVLMIFGGNRLEVWAQENSFVIEAKLLPTNNETYDIQVNVENLGSDWEGTARLMVVEDYMRSTAYDTVISLPQGSTKQFVVKVPIDSVDDTDGTIKITLWDKKSQKSAEKQLKRFLKEDAEALTMGILSDNYSNLTYLDMGGEELYYYGTEYPIKLLEVNQDNLVDTLDSLVFLVIDSYNTGVLTDEQLQAIELWNYDGGVLIVGTGKYAEDTLRGLGDSYLDVECADVYEPEEVSQFYYTDYMDWSQLSMAGLRDKHGQYNEQYLTNAWTCAIGDGAIGILPYSLTELAKVDDTFYDFVTQTEFVMNILDEASMEANSRYDYSTSSSYYYSNHNMIYRMLRMIGSINSPLQFGVLKLLVILYVIFVGPVLYIILRIAKKRELYWAAVPVAALLGVVLISFAGKGFEVTDAKVYSVSTENLSQKEEGKSYLSCYDAKNKEWELEMAKDYEYVGPFMNDSYYYGEEEDNYYYHIKKEGETLSVGIKPSSNFEDSFFYAGKSGGSNWSNGSIVCKGVAADWAGITGTVTNETDKDFAYYAVLVNDTLYVFENLPAGESCNLAENLPVYSAPSYDIGYDYLYDFLEEIKEDEKAEKVSALAALGVGICTAYPENDISKTVVVGVVEDWNKTIEDDCSEIAYGCLYVIQ